MQAGAAVGVGGAGEPDSGGRGKGEVGSWWHGSYPGDQRGNKVSWPRPRRRGPQEEGLAREGHGGEAWWAAGHMGPESGGDPGHV